MPPKKKDEGPKSSYLGRPGNNVKMGIVGIPNVGKSTFFNCLTKLNIPAENFPFCTIEPNQATVPVPDKRFNWLVKKFGPKSEVQALLNVTDIAGLVKGASEGAGLGNAFLSHIMAIDGIFHMLRGFEGSEVTHVDGAVDPIRDMSTIQDELLLKDIKTLGDKIDADRRAVERGGANAKKLKADWDCLVKAKAYAEDPDGPREMRFGHWSEAEVEVLNTVQLLTSKPVCFLVNLTKKAYLTQKSKWLGPVGNSIKERGTGELIIPWSGRFEEELLDAEAGGSDAVDAFFLDNDGAESALPRIIKTGYQALGLVSFFTCGKDEVRQWTVRAGRSAPQAAGVIHTDFEKGFIMAETYAFKDIKKLGDEAAVRKAGKYRQEGKKYIVADGDIFFFKFNN